MLSVNRQVVGSSPTRVVASHFIEMTYVLRYNHSKYLSTVLERYILFWLLYGFGSKFLSALKLPLFSNVQTSGVAYALSIVRIVYGLRPPTA